MNHSIFVQLKFMRKLNIFLVIFFCINAGAQTNPREHISSFNMTSLTYKFDQNWMAYLELQARGIEDYSKIDYYEMKGGIGYNIGKHQPFIGVGKYGTYRNSRFYQNELRLWLQYIYSHGLLHGKIDHRLRAEKRFYKYPQTDATANTERYRYRMSVTYPLNSKKITTNTLFANAFEEVFFGPELPTFKRNRLFGGLGYVFSPNVSTNLGYMWQREFNAQSTRNLHFLYFALNFTLKNGDIDVPAGIPVAD